VFIRYTESTDGWKGKKVIFLRGQNRMVEIYTDPQHVNARRWTRYKVDRWIS
jgi:hypothetical protein